MFGWIVSSINEMLAPELHQKRLAGGRPGRAQAVAPTYEIGVLDIFGFENFKTNSFEQVRTVLVCVCVCVCVCVSVCMCMRVNRSSEANHYLSYPPPTPLFL